MNDKQKAPPPQQFPFKSWFMIVLEGNVTVGKGNRRRLKPTIVREMFYIQGNEEIMYCPAQLLVHAEQQQAAKHGGNRFVATNAFRVLVSDKDVSDAESEEE